MEEQLALVTSSGRPFELIDVRVVDEEGSDVAKDSQQVRQGLGAAAAAAVGRLVGGATSLSYVLPSVLFLQAHNQCVAALSSDPPHFHGVQVGEVWVRGPTVFAGYWGLPEATAESFADGGWFK